MFYFGDAWDLLNCGKSFTMTHFIYLIAFLISSFSSIAVLKMSTNTSASPNESYSLVVEGFDWGPGASKIILPNKNGFLNPNADDFAVSVKRSSECGNIPEAAAAGEIPVTFAYASDENGKRTQDGKYLTLVLKVGPDFPLSNPLQWYGNGKCPGNAWVDFDLTIRHDEADMVWLKEARRLHPLVDEFEQNQKYFYQKEKYLSYAFYKPQKEEGEKKPLVIWLHGGGEGGFDTTLPLLANRAANYASPEIQTIFNGAHVLVPQCPGAWMHNEKGISTMGRENDIYNGILMSLIKEYVRTNPDIDTDRIYIGGCSNGGYMSLKLLILFPDYFAAAYISALAYESKYITDKQIESIKDIPIWFIHSKDDRVTPPATTAVPVYERLIEANASNVHFSYFDHVTDLTGVFGGKDYHYNGHFSWIYSHTNKCYLDYDGQPVLHNGKKINIMEWMANQKKNK